MSLISSRDLSITDCFCLLQWTNFVRTYITVLYVVEKIKLYTHVFKNCAKHHRKITFINAVYDLLLGIDVPYTHFLNAL